MNTPIVSLVVPTKNSSATLEDCLRSIKAQTYDIKKIELIVVDNFSTDKTPEIARMYTKAFFSRGPERSAQRNYGASKAKGEYLMMIDSDMELDSHVIEQCVEQMRQSPDVAGVIIPEESFGEGFWAQCKKLERSFYIGVPYMEAARFFKKKEFLKVGGYDVALVSGEDWDLSQRIEKLGKLSRCSAFIYHNEGKISLNKSVRKKYYYAKQFASYVRKSKRSDNLRNQVSVLGRYKLFFSHPVRLFRNPFIGIGMLFMKTCEFAFGAAGYIRAKISIHD